MKLDARMVNLLGLLAMVVVLGLGAIGIVKPLYAGVQSTQAELESQRSTNGNLELKLTALNAAQQRESEIGANVASLRAQLPEGQEGDSVLQAISDAVTASGAVIVEDSYASPVPFVPRGSEEDVPAAETPAEPAPADGGESAGATDEVAQEPGAPSVATGQPVQLQSEVTLRLGVTGNEMAAVFTDALAQSPRSLLVTSAAMTDTEVEGHPYELTVSLMIYYYDVAVEDE